MQIHLDYDRAKKKNKQIASSFAVMLRSIGVVTSKRMVIIIYSRVQETAEIVFLK